MDHGLMTHSHKPETRFLCCMKQQSRGQARWITMVFFILSGLLSATWQSRIPEVQEKIGLGHAAWGLVLASLPVGLVVGILFASYLVTSFGTRKVMVVSCTVMAVFLALTGLADERGWLMGVLFLMGMSRTILNISINTQSMEVQQLYDRPIVSLFHGIWSLACLAAGAIGQVMIIYGILPSAHFTAIALLCILLALYFGKPGPSGQHAVPEKRPFFVKPDRYLLALGIMTFCIMLCEGTMFEWSVNYYEKEIRAEKQWVTAGFNAFVIAMALGRIFGDRFIQRFGQVPILIFNAFLMACGFGLAAFFPFLLPATIGLLLIGLGDSILIPVVYTMAARSRKMPASYALASVSIIGSWGFIVGPVLIGTVSEAFGLSTAFALVGLIALCICLLAMYVRKQVP